MKKVYSSQDIALMYYLRNLLEDHGIACVIKDENISLVDFSERAPLVFWPEIWVMDDSKGSEALALIEEAIPSVVSVGNSWRCPHCGEEVEGAFTACWNCGKSRTEGDAS